MAGNIVDEPQQERTGDIVCKPQLPILPVQQQLASGVEESVSFNVPVTVGTSETISWRWNGFYG